MDDHDGKGTLTMARLLLILFPILLAAAIILSIRACQNQPSNVEIRDAEKAGLVALSDGSTMIAKDGTVGRDLVDWLASRHSTEKSFELGGHQFVGRTTEPTAETLGRIPRLVAMLKANPDVKAVIVGHTDPSGDATVDRDVALKRAQTLANLLEDGGIDAQRLTVESVGASEPLTKSDTKEGRASNQRVSLTLLRP